jgi:hypothetical protein
MQVVDHAFDSFALDVEQGINQVNARLQELATTSIIKLAGDVLDGCQEFLAGVFVAIGL